MTAASQSQTDQPPLHRPGPWPIVLSLGVGAVGGGLCALIGIPLAWMIGPMVANIIASVRGLPVLVPHGARVVVIAFIGVLLGGSFSPDLLQRLPAWGASLALVFVFIPLITVIAAWYYQRFAGFDRATATFAGAPGTLTAMTIIGGESGADERMIALSQGLRVVVVVFLMPLVVSAILGAGHGAASVLPAGGPFSVHDGAFLLGAAFAGFIGAKLVRLPAAAMSGAMLASAALYLGGVVTWRPPDAAMWVSLWILGSAIGSRFSTVTAATFFRVSRHAVLATIVILLVSAAFATAVSGLTGTPFLTALLSFTPGGVAEMCLIAIAFDIDPAFVAVHHLLRIAILITAAPLAAAWLFKRPRQ